MMGYTGEASPKRGTFFRLSVCQRVRNSRVEIYRRVEYVFLPFLVFKRAVWRPQASSLDEEQQHAVETSRSK